jgi:hypothetical protein
MTEPILWSRVHAYLDGELGLEQLSDVERAHLARMQHSLDAVAGSLNLQPAPDLAEAVMQRVRQQEEARAGRSLWARLRPALMRLWAPRPVSFTFRPAYALALSLLLLAGFWLRPSDEAAFAGSTAMSAADEAAAAMVYVQFRIEVPSARQVALAGSFTEWEPRILMEESRPGVWTAFVPVPPGVHDYTFVVDGERWVVDPYAPQVDDSFGGRNNRLPVPNPLRSS